MEALLEARRENRLRNLRGLLGDGEDDTGVDAVRRVAAAGLTTTPYAYGQPAGRRQPSQTSPQPMPQPSPLAKLRNEEGSRAGSAGAVLSFQT